MREWEKFQEQRREDSYAYFHFLLNFFKLFLLQRLYSHVQISVHLYVSLLIRYRLARDYLSVIENFRVDMRSNNVTGKPILIHKKGSKVVGLHCNPLQPDLLLSCGNDHFVRFFTILFMLCFFWWHFTYCFGLNHYLHSVAVKKNRYIWHE